LVYRVKRDDDHFLHYAPSKYALNDVSN